jgi:hypothetical protein
LRSLEWHRDVRRWRAAALPEERESMKNDPLAMVPDFEEFKLAV